MFEISKPLHTCRHDQPGLAHSWNGIRTHLLSRSLSMPCKEAESYQISSSTFPEVLDGRKEHSAHLGVFDI